MSVDNLLIELRALRGKLRPEPTEDERAEKAAEDNLRAEIHAARLALRVQENEDIIAKHAPTPKTRRFFDFDADQEYPATIEHNGATCALYTRFVVRGANADQLDRLSDAITLKDVDKQGKPVMAIDTARITAITAECGEQCVVYPTAETAGVSAEQHTKNVKASLWYLGAARALLGAAAKEIGEEAAKLHRSKS